jgi:hypothetical protein
MLRIAGLDLNQQVFAVRRPVGTIRSAGVEEIRMVDDLH